MKLEAFSPESVGNAFLDLHEQMTSGDFLAALLVSLVSAAAAALLYRFFYERRGTGSQIHRAFPLLSLAVTTLFIGVQVSLPLSLGLLGSLSIIRFRTPIKEPEEVGFIMLVIASSILAATHNFHFMVILYVIAIATLFLVRGASGWGRLRRDGIAGTNTRIVTNHFAHCGGMLHADLVKYYAPHGIEPGFDGMRLPLHR